MNDKLLILSLFCLFFLIKLIVSLAAVLLLFSFLLKPSPATFLLREKVMKADGSIPAISSFIFKYSLLKQTILTNFLFSLEYPPTTLIIVVVLSSFSLTYFVTSSGLLVITSQI